ncbi:PAXNEB protein [Hirsutella rhossiliensis]|uniref:Elongator complex protein 4 n=1 Tax=Hirsutella rhossiliensis TaxID=111463 RepID=A0A9P8MTV4_9HYPO|nr:PAXNEB protein [Hirsutella rhossiliensis]KAH0960329.1 PAXNEB protein [Hirsutella rhossiliensis]
MRIAWRYEALSNVSAPATDAQAGPASPDDAEPFCHSFDLTKRLESSAIRGQLHSLHGRDFQGHLAAPPFKPFLDDVAAKLASSPPLSVHRILVPNLLSPTVYGSAACQPHEVLQFLHGLRSILRQFPAKATALATLPVSLYPRTTGLTRWMELLSDGVIELVSLPRHATTNHGSDRDGNFQGLLRVHSLPVFHERGGGLANSCLREDRSFKLSASNGMVIMPFSLPPVGDQDSQPSEAPESKVPKQSLDF